MWRYGAIVVLLSVVLLDEGYGCTCMPHSRPCEYLRNSAVFVGQVIETQPAQHEFARDRWSDGFAMRFSVEEVLSGSLGAEVVVKTGRGGGDCGTPLSPGARFLVFAYRNFKGELETGLCSGNRELNGAGESLQLLKDLRDLVKTGKGSISGSVRQQGIGFEETRPKQSMTVHAKSEGFSATARTGEDGSFMFDDLPTGKYQVTLETPGGWDLDHRYDPLDQGDVASGACAQVRFVLRPATRIRGRIFVPAGEEPRHMIAFAVSVPHSELDRSERPALVDGDGHFELWPLPPGDYLVRVSFANSATEHVLLLPVYYPGVPGKTAAAIVHLEEGQSKDVDLLLPAIGAPRKVQFVAVDGNGRPMRAVKVELEDMRRPGEMESEVSFGLDADGGGFVMISPGYSYQLHASTSPTSGQALCSKPVQIAAGTTPVHARFVMDRTGADCDLEKIDGASSR
jgi:hypothetical protein